MSRRINRHEANNANLNLVKLGQALSYTELDEKDIEKLLIHLHDFMKFMVHEDVINSVEYAHTSAEYHRKAM